MEIWKQNNELLKIELFEIMKTKEEILSITRLERKKGSCRPVLVEVQNESEMEHRWKSKIVARK